MKKIIAIISIFLILILMYFLQVNFFNWYNILGVSPNLFVIFVLIMGLFLGDLKGLFIGVAAGLLLDFFTGTNIGFNAISLGTVGFIGGLLDKNFSKENMFNIIIMLMLTTIVNEVIIYTLKITICKATIELLPFLKIVVLEVLYNIVIFAIFYPILIKIGEKLNTTFTKEKGFMRYY